MQGSQLEPSKSWHEYLTLPYQAAKPGTTYLKCGHNIAAPIHRDAKVFEFSKNLWSLHCISI